MHIKQLTMIAIAQPIGIHVLNHVWIDVAVDSPVSVPAASAICGRAMDKTPITTAGPYFLNNVVILSPYSLSSVDCRFNRHSSTPHLSFKNSASSLKSAQVRSSCSLLTRMEHAIWPNCSSSI
uniref:Plasmid conjugative transfer protein TraM n=1 Tax=Escherichia coli TaxID=562 RepID=A0A385EN04_ECOLX|nr:plasmid conjugative transfer protein TraM [Escherichia coli]